MSFLTVPPPLDDDHEDVAWALRAASAQWKRDAHEDAIHWVKRASETAREVGAAGRAQELSGLAMALTNASMPLGSVPPAPAGLRPASMSGAMAPPPIPGAVAPPPIPGAVAPPPPPGAVAFRAPAASLIDVDIEEVDFEEEIEEIDDDIELIDDDVVEEVDEVFDVTPEPASVEQPGRSEVGIPQGSYRSVPPAALPPLSARSRPPVSTGELDEETLRDELPKSSRPPTSRRSPRSRRPSRARHRSRSAPSPSNSASDDAQPPASRSSAPPRRSRTGRTTTSPRLDRIPPSMRPEPSGLDLDEDVEEELSQDSSRAQEYGELRFGVEAETRRLDSKEPPPIPDLGPLPIDDSTELPIENQTAAEYAQSRGRLEHDHEELERELGVDLSLRGFKRPSQPPGHETAPEEDESVRVSSYPSSVPPGVIESEPRAADSQIPELDVNRSPVPGRASTRPSQRSVASVPRMTSSNAEPYGLAPSAQMPPIVTPSELPAIEPPSSPTAAPPPASMSEPSSPYSSPPSSMGTPGVSDLPPASAAPDPEEFEELFSKISVPPVASRDSVEPPSAEQAPTFGNEDVTLARRQRTSMPASPSVDQDGAILVDGLDLMGVDGFQDLPEDSAFALAQKAELRTLAPGEEISGFGLAIVTHGSVTLMPSVADASCRVATKGQVLFTEGTLEDSATVRVVGLEEGSRVAIFSKTDLKQAVSSCPWVGDELAEVADSHLAFAGAVLGALGDSLDEVFRFMVLDKCTVKRRQAGDLIAQGGQPMDGMYILGGGTLEEVDAEGKVLSEIVMGDFVFPETVLSAAPARNTVRAGAAGALVLYAPRMAAHELLATCPPFIELLAR